MRPVAKEVASLSFYSKTVASRCAVSLAMQSLPKPKVRSRWANISILDSPTHLYTPVLELTAKGVEVVQADFDDLESVKRAFSGAYGVFGVTDCTTVIASL